MPLIDLSAAPPPAGIVPGRLVGLDLGTRTIGVAIGDPSGRIATTLGLVRRTKLAADLAALAALLKGRQPAGFVLGLPLRLSGEKGPEVQRVRAFARDLLRNDVGAGLDAPVFLWDERLSTAAVTRAMIEEGDVTRQRRADAVDAAAAVWILQGALDALARRRAAVAPETTA